MRGGARKKIRFLLARFYAYVHNPNHQPMSTTTASTKRYPATRHSLSCGCEGDVPLCPCRSARLVQADELTGDEVAALPAADREAALDTLCAELSLWDDGHWELVDAVTEECPTCDGRGWTLAKLDDSEWSEPCDDCSGVGRHRVRPAGPTEADYELAAAVAGPETHLRTMPLSAVLRQVVGEERATVRPAPAMPRIAARVTATLRPAATAVAEREVA